MAHAKFDGIIEAVHYAPNGKIAVVRLYERRGAAWSDHILLERKELVERLKKGRRFALGQRKTYWAGTFETGKVVHLLADGGSIVTENQTGERDLLAGMPIF